jgi:hypothetical protein
MTAVVPLMAAALTLVLAGCGAATSTPVASVAPAASPTAAISVRPAAPPSPVATPSPAPSASRFPTLPPPPGVYLAPLGPFPPKTLQALVTFYKDKYNLTVTILPTAAIDPSARDPQRKQLVAERLLSSLPSAYPRVVANPTAIIIAVVADDLYIQSRTDWDWAFGLRDEPRLAVVSTARMSFPGNASTALQLTRLRKMVTRDLGVLYFHFPFSDDPGNLLYSDIAGVDDLDRVGEDLPSLLLPGPASF